MSATVWKHIQSRIESGTKSRVVPFRVPNIQKPPFVSFTIRTAEPIHTKDSSPDQDILRLEVKCFNINHEHMITDAEAIRTKFDRYQGTLEGTTIKNSRCVEWLIPEAPESEKGNVVFECLYVYEIRLEL